MHMVWSFMTGQTVKDMVYAMIYRFALYDSLPQSYLDRIRECSAGASLSSYYTIPPSNTLSALPPTSIKSAYVTGQQQVLHNSDERSDTSSVASLSVASSRRIITVSTNLKKVMESPLVAPSAEQGSSSSERDKSVHSLSPDRLLKWSYSQRASVV